MVVELDDVGCWVGCIVVVAVGVVDMIAGFAGYTPSVAGCGEDVVAAFACGHLHRLLSCFVYCPWSLSTEKRPTAPDHLQTGYV